MSNSNPAESSAMFVNAARAVSANNVGSFNDSLKMAIAEGFVPSGQLVVSPDGRCSLLVVKYDDRLKKIFDAQTRALDRMLDEM
jgi:hypothetical protein